MSEPKLCLCGIGPSGDWECADCPSHHFHPSVVAIVERFNFDHAHRGRLLASALQKLMDERDGAFDEGRATAAAKARAEAAEADAALAWRRVTELQESNTALVLERRAANSKLTEARATITRLNRRCQLAESVADQNVEAVKRSGGPTLGRGLANYACNRILTEARELLDAHDVGERLGPDPVIAGLRALLARWGAP